jgi:hypothetical protein
MGRVIRILMLAALLALPQARAFNGAYVWGGYLTQDSGVQGFYDSVGYALNRGFGTVRIAITPSETSDLSISGQCATPSLACYAQIMFASGVWDNANLQRVIITTLDWSCYQYEPANLNNGCLYAPDLTANQAAIKAEYTALFNVLKSRFGSRNIQFVIDNWEGDNFAFCSSAYNVGGSATTSAACLATFTGGQTFAQRSAALVQWVGYRDAAVNAFVVANPGFNMISALEFNSLTLFCQGETTSASTCAAETSGCQGTCNPSTDTVLDQVTAAGGRAYCSYSSWDSIANGSLPEDALNILSRGCSHLIIGEAGAAVDNSTVAAVQNVYWQVCIADQLPNVMGSVLWNLVYPGSGLHYGLFNGSGTNLNIGNIGCLQPSRPSIPLWK